MLAAGLPVSFVGVVIALLVLLPETMAAANAARRGRIQTSLNLALGSAMASIGLTIPTLAVASIWIPTPLRLGLGATQIVLLAITVVVGVLTVVPGRATRLQAQRPPHALRGVPLPRDVPLTRVPTFPPDPGTFSWAPLPFRVRGEGSRAKPPWHALGRHPQAADAVPALHRSASGLVVGRPPATTLRGHDARLPISAAGHHPAPRTCGAPGATAALAAPRLDPELVATAGASTAC